MIQCRSDLAYHLYSGISVLRRTSPTCGWRWWEPNVFVNVYKSNQPGAHTCPLWVSGSTAGLLVFFQYHLDKRQCADRVERHGPHLCRLRLGGSSATLWCSGCGLVPMWFCCMESFFFWRAVVGLRAGIKDEGGLRHWKPVNSHCDSQ